MNAATTNAERFFKFVTYFADTWEFDGASWTPVTTASSPPARSNHGMAFDAGSNQTVLFGGMGETLEIFHRAQSRETFARGAVRAARGVPPERHWRRLSAVLVLLREQPERLGDLLPYRSLPTAVLAVDFYEPRSEGTPLTAAQILQPVRWLRIAGNTPGATRNPDCCRRRRGSQ